MYCADCGTFLPDAAKYCLQCGAGVVAGRSPGVPSSQARGRMPPDPVSSPPPPPASLQPAYRPLTETERWDTRRSAFEPQVELDLTVWRRRFIVADVGAEIDLPASGVRITLAGKRFIVVRAPGVLWSYRSPRRYREEHIITRLRRQVEAVLERCDTLVWEIENSSAMDSLPLQEPLRQHYLHALELRSEGVRLFERAMSAYALWQAEEHLTLALREIEECRRNVSLSS